MRALARYGGACVPSYRRGSMPAKDSQSRTTRRDGRPISQPPPRPWRTEGLPKGQQPKRHPSRWLILAAWLLGYAVFFGLLTLQDRMSGPQAVPYTEFKAQVANKNVSEVFARGNTIEGALKKPAPPPGQAQKDKGQSDADQQGPTYHKFTTERPTFAVDDLLSELIASGATVRATPIVQQRGIFWNL